MTFNIEIIGLGTLVGIIINLLFNRKITIYKIIGVFIILIAGVFASLVFLYPFYFGSYNNLVLSLILICTLLVGLYIAAHIIANKFIILKCNDTSIGAFKEDEKVQKNRLRVYNYEMSNRKQKRTKTTQLVKIGVALSKVEDNALPSKDGAENDYPTNNREDGSKQALLNEEIITKSAQTEPEIYDMAQTENTESHLMIDQKESADIIENAAFSQNDGSEGMEGVFNHEQRIDTIPTQQLNMDSDKSIQTKTENNDIFKKGNAESDVMIDQDEGINVNENITAFSQNDGSERMEGVFGGEQKSDTIPTQQFDADSDKYAALISKAWELMKQAKYLYAIQLLQVCLNSSENKTLQKQADMLLIECFILANQYLQAQNKWFDILNKKYVLEPADKIKLKELIIELKKRLNVVL